MGSLPLPADPGEVVSSPAQQTVQLIRSLHRESRSVIQFLPLKPGGEVPPGWPKRIPASDLDTPGFADDLLAEPDTLMTINGLREGASNARAENVRYLNALWVDCDCHDLTRDEQEAQLQALESSGLLPPPSVVVWSGRGFWLLWKLIGGRGTAPPTVDEGRGALHREIASEIVQAIEQGFPDLRPDKASINVNRLTRVPGSINSKSGTPVRWEVRDLGKCYRLEEYPRRNTAPRKTATLPVATSARGESTSALAPHPSAFEAIGDLNDPADTRQLLRLLHRGDYGYIRFCRFNGPDREEIQWHHWIEANALDDPAFELPWAEIGAETYCSINSFFRPGTGKQEDLRWLNAVYADLDAPDVPPDALQAGVASLVEQGVLPPVSLQVVSGGGLWCLWLLEDDGPISIPSKAFPWLQDRHRKVQEAINGAIKGAAPELKPDLGVTDRARMIRLPGTVHGRSGAVVRWDVLDHYAVYTLAELEQVFDLPSPETTTEGGAKIIPFPAPAGKTSKRAPRWKYELEDFETLRATRAGFREGCRSRAAYYYAYLLRMNGVTDDEIRKAVQALGEECVPPLSATACRSAVESARRITRFVRRSTFARDLQVTREEAVQLKRWGSEDGLPEGPDTSRPRARRWRPEERQEAILAEIQELHGEIPSIRTMHTRLRQKGIRITRDTIAKDYQSLGLC
jgi:hypothetical protein